MQLVVELLSRIIYKPPCSPSAAPCCLGRVVAILVASIVSFICVISKQWSFSGLEGQFTDTGSQGHTVLLQKTSGSFGAVKKAADIEFSLKFAGDDSAILISVCLRIFEISIANLTLEILYCHLFEISPSTSSHRCGFLFTSVRG